MRVRIDRGGLNPRHQQSGKGVHPARRKCAMGSALLVVVSAACYSQKIDGGKRKREAFEGARKSTLATPTLISTAVSGGIESGFQYAPVSAKVASDLTFGGTGHGECLLDRLA